MADEAGAAVHYEQSSPSLLAATPALARVSQGVTVRDWENLRLQLEQRLYSLRTYRTSWRDHWAKIAENILPRRMQWLSTPEQAKRGLAINQAIKDPTATQALRIATAGMRDGLMSSSRPWFKIKPGIDSEAVDGDAQGWFDDVEAVLYAVMAGSNFYSAGTQMFEDLLAFGTGPKIIYEDMEDIIRCFNPVCGEYMLGTNSKFRIDSMYRTFNLTLLQLVDMFGLDSLGAEIKAAWNTKGAMLDQEYIVAHAIEPNFPLAQAGHASSADLGVVPGGYAYREFYWLWGRATEGPLSKRGFRDKPFIAPRWATTSNDPYGRAPGMDALPDVLQLHQMTMRQAEAIDKMVRPPMMADAQLKNQPSSILPGRVTYVTDLAKGMKPIYEVKPEIEEMSGLIAQLQKRIEKWFFVDLFQMMDNLQGVQPRNAIEIAERRGEKLQVLGPVVEGVEQELAAAIRRIYAICKRRNLIPPMPKSLHGVPIHFDINSMIAIAQKAAATATMERTMQVAAQLAPLFPGRNPLDNFDSDLFIRQYADDTAFPAKIKRGMRMVEQMRQQQAAAAAQAQKEQQAMQVATHAAPAVASAMKDVSQTDVGGGLNAMQMLLGNGGQTQDGAPGVMQ